MPDDDVNVSQPTKPKDWYAGTSVPLKGGGDTHLHPVPGGIMVTTRLPGGVEVHDPILEPPLCRFCGRPHPPGGCGI